MRKDDGLSRTGVIAFLVLLSLLSRAHSASAEGRGGTISLGEVFQNTVEIHTTVASADDFSGFNIHVVARVGTHVTLTEIAAVNETLLQGECPSFVPAAHEFVFGCAAGTQSNYPYQSMSAPTILARFTFVGTGSGCIGVRLVSAPGDELLDTYTVDSRTSTAQAVTINRATTNILIGGGIAADCAGLDALPSVGSGSKSGPNEWTWLAVSALAMGTAGLGLGVRRKKQNYKTSTSPDSNRVT